MSTNGCKPMDIAFPIIFLCCDVITSSIFQVVIITESVFRFYSHIYRMTHLSFITDMPWNCFLWILFSSIIFNLNHSASICWILPPTGCFQYLLKSLSFTLFEFFAGITVICFSVLLTINPMAQQVNGLLVKNLTYTLNCIFHST